MTKYLGEFLFLLLLVFLMLNVPRAFGEEQIQSVSFHTDHLNDIFDEFPNDYRSFIIPIADTRQIMVAPFITCTIHENDEWHPNHTPCRMAQTIINKDWNEGTANYTYTFEDWVDYDWNDVIVNLYASTTYGFSADLFLSFREAAWMNPFGVEITAEETWIIIQWNSTDYPVTNSRVADRGETVRIDLFSESEPSDEAFIRFLIPPIADFTWTPHEPTVGELVLFDAAESYDPDEKVNIYQWIFGDGGSVKTNNPTTTHNFTTPGTYVVTLTVTDSDGLTDFISKSIHISGVIGGETESMNPALIIAWEKTNLFLIAAFVAVVAFLRMKSKSN